MSEQKPWHKLPTPLGLLKLIRFRNALRENNLHDTSQLGNPEKLPQPQPSPDESHLYARTVDGSYNDLEQPEMGMVGTRFGRNAALDQVYPDKDKLLTPNPRLISRQLLTRKEFIPAESLNLLAAAWIQFQSHDWFGHGDNQPHDRPKIEVSLEDDDPWPLEKRPLAIRRTLDDPTHPPDDKPPTYINHVTHWWDASQIYGSDAEKVEQLRTHVDGKVIIGDDGLLPLDPNLNIDLTGFNDNWWVGLSLLHTLFVKEHNLLCDHLKQKYPDWTDAQLYNHARLINAALMAKIHTTEWTPGILDHPVLQIAMSVNWWGFLGQQFKQIFGRVGDSELLSGIVGSQTDHHTAPYYITEEFVSVYRLHPLIPDELRIYSLKNGQEILETNFFEASGRRTRAILEQVAMDDFFYTFGITHPGAITLHNYPHFLQNLVRDDGETFDLAAVDIIRDRERGVPRYNRFREIIGRGKVSSFEEITSNPVWAKELKEVYNNDLESVDLMVGMFAEDLPQGFGFSDTAFRVFILMASRRLSSDRFFTKDYRAEVYTQFGLDWIDKNTMLDVICRHYPQVSPALLGVKNAFAPWRKVGVAGY